MQFHLSLGIKYLQDIRIILRFTVSALAEHQRLLYPISNARAQYLHFRYINLLFCISIPSLYNTIMGN